VPALVPSPVARIAVHRVPGGGVSPETRPSLLTWLAAIPDFWDRRGRRHGLVAVLAVAVCAVLAGAKSFTAVGEWAADAPPDMLVASGIRPDPWSGWVRAPDEATLRRVLTGIDADALDTVLGTWMAATTSRPQPTRAVERPSWRPIAVDGKTQSAQICDVCVSEGGLGHVNTPSMLRMGVHAGKGNSRRRLVSTACLLHPLACDVMVNLSSRNDRRSEAEVEEGSLRAPSPSWRWVSTWSSSPPSRTIHTKVRTAFLQLRDLSYRSARSAIE
jgi:DDE_Tnp_1-associated